MIACFVGLLHLNNDMLICESALCYLSILSDRCVDLQSSHQYQPCLFCMSLQLLKSEEDASYKPVKKACTQLVDNLVEHILKYEESLAGKMMIDI